MAKKNDYQVAVDGSADFVAPRRKGKKHNWWKYVLTFISGQLSLIVLLVVGVVIAASSFTTGALLEIAGQNPEEILNAEFADNTVFEAVMKFSSGYEPKCINDLTEILSEDIINEYVTKITDAAGDVGITFTDEEIKGNEETGVKGLYGTPFDELGDWFSEKIETIELANVLGSETLGMDELLNNGIMKKLLYNTKNEENPDFDETQEEGPGNYRYIENPDYDDTKPEGDDNHRWKQVIDLDNPKTLKEITDGGLDLSNLVTELSLTDILGDPLPDGFDFLSSVANTPLGSLGDELFDVPLKDILGINMDTASDLMKVIGEKTINDIKDGDIASGLKISDVLEVSDDSPAILKVLKDCYISDVPEDAPAGSKTISEKINDITLNDVLGDTSSNAVLQRLLDKEVKVTDIGSVIEDVINETTIGEALGGEPPESGIVATLWDTTIGGMSDKIDTLQLKDVLPDAVGADGILGALAECYLTNVPEGAAAGSKTLTQKIDTITIGEVIDLDQSNDLLAAIDTTQPVTSLGTQFTNMKIATVFKSTIFETNDDGSIKVVSGEPVYKEGQGIWRYLFVEKQETTPVTYIDKYDEYKLTDMTKMTTNMANNITKATLQELVDDGILDIAQTTLDKHVNPLDPSSATIGSLTILGIVDVVAGV